MHNPSRYPAAGDVSWISDLPGRGRHFVYHLCAVRPGIDPEEEVAHVYIGVTSDLRSRLRAHARKWWWATIDPRLVELLEHPTRASAEAEERDLIHFYQPAMNRSGRLLVVTPV